MRVRLTPRVLADLQRIEQHIQLDNPPAARAIAERIVDRCLTLIEFPAQGRAIVGGRRMLVIAGTPYVAIYRIVRDEARILRIFHGRQRRPR